MAALMCSCRGVKKLSSALQTHKDSTTAKTSVHVDVKKTDTAGTTTTTTTTKKNVDSGYKKTTTVVKEWFSDEFGEDDSTVKNTVNKEDYSTGIVSTRKKDTAKKSHGMPLYRETVTMVEEGNKKSNEDVATATAQASNKQSVDSSHKDDNEKTNVVEHKKQVQESKTQLTILPWWFILILGVVFFIVVYILYKKQ